MGKQILAIDIGTSGVKVCLFSTNLMLVASRTVEYNTYFPKQGYAEQDPNEWWKATVQALDELHGEFDLSEVVGVGVDGQSWSAIPIDINGNVLGRTPIWYDTRAEKQCERLSKSIGDERIFNIAKNRLEACYTLPKILWLKENSPEIYSKTYKFLQSNSFIVYKLTSVISQDKSQSYGYQCYDMAKGVIDYTLAGEMGIDTDKIPHIYECQDVVGSITKEVAQVTHLQVGTPVIAGGLDAACGTLGVGVINPGESQEQSGQAGGMSICIDSPIGEASLILGNHVVPRRWLLQGGTVGGSGVLRWLEAEFHDNSKKHVFNDKYMEFCMPAEDVPAGSNGLIFLPYMSGERSPIWNPKAKGVFFGLDFSKTRGHVIRAALEGVAYSLKHNLDVAEKAGVKVKELYASGGAAKSPLWTQIKADVTGKVIHTANGDIATSLGTAMLTCVGIGVFQSFTEAKEKTIKYNKEYVPNVKYSQIYHSNFGKYLKIYEATKDLM